MIMYNIKKCKHTVEKKIIPSLINCICLLSLVGIHTLSGDFVKKVRSALQKVWILVCP